MHAFFMNCLPMLSVYTISVNSIYSIHLWLTTRLTLRELVGRIHAFLSKTVYSGTDLAFRARFCLSQSLSLRQGNRIPALHRLLGSWANSWVFNWWPGAKQRTKSEIHGRMTCLDKNVWSRIYVAITISCCYAEASTGIFQIAQIPLTPFQFAFVPPSTVTLNFPFSGD